MPRHPGKKRKTTRKTSRKKTSHKPKRKTVRKSNGRKIQPMIRRPERTPVSKRRISKITATIVPRRSVPFFTGVTALRRDPTAVDPKHFDRPQGGKRRFRQHEKNISQRFRISSAAIA